MSGFKTIVHESLATSGVVGRLAAHPAVVLERIARGGGEVRWYFCRDEAQLGELEGLLRPGSAVSFYFDDRIRSEPEPQVLRDRVESSLASTNEVMIGALHGDRLTIDALLVSDTLELDEFVGRHADASRFFHGVFPARDNDGVAAVTLILPDADGIVRPHPH